ncbi:MAG: hypothetical protein LBR69_05540, partial [Endomicrobium sp.]|nr:hypothetical protein [Endomicrobium sp.]
MRKIVFLFLSIICLLVSYGNAEVKSEQQINMDKIIKEIRKKYTEINSKFSTYDKKTLSLFGESTQGAGLTGYYKNGSLEKIEACYYGEMGRYLEEYYCNDNKFFFVYSKSFQYESSIYDSLDANKDVKIVSEREGRYYFNDEKLIKWISGKEVINSKSEKFIECENRFVKDFKKYRDIFILNDISKYDAYWEGQNPIEKSNKSKKMIDSNQTFVAQEFLLGKWVAKDGNPSMNVYTFK